MNALDLTFLSIYRINGQEWPLLPGLVAQNPPKKLARGRDQDRLMVYLTLAGNVSYSEGEYSEIVSQLVETFYNTPGSLTFALKTAAASLNSNLVERNMKSTGKGLYSIGALVLCNLRGNSMYIVQCGPTHVYHFSGEMRHLHDPQLAGKGLGLSQTARMYFSQIILSPDDRVLVCAALPPNWDKTISEARSWASLEASRRKLLAVTDVNVSALLIQASAGTGAMNVVPAVKDVVLEPASPVGLSSDVAVPGSAVMEKPPVLDVSLVEMADGVILDSQSPEAVVQDLEESQLPADENIQPASLAGSPPASFGKRRSDARVPKDFVQPVVREKFEQGIRSTARRLARVLQNWRTLTQKLTTFGEKVILRLFPDEEDQPLSSISRTWAIFLAVAIPILFLVVARIVYYQLGYESQFNLYYGRAQQAAQQAQAELDPAALRVEWQTALDWLDKADQYELTKGSKSQDLRQTSQNALDGLDKIVRFDFSLAFNTPLSRNLQVSRMAATNSDIYMLDSVQGSVLRGTYNNKTYDLDTTFKCGPGTFNGIQVDNLIDIVALPRAGNTGATILGIDASGNLLYCIPGETPKATFLEPPLSGWKGITSIVFDADNLFVLDAPARAVWVYWGSDNLEFIGKPFFFFEEQIPVMLEQAIGMAINGDDLYLLHADGHLTTCTFSHIDPAPTRCNDPALYIDTRLGYEGGMSLSDGIFSQITFTSPPDPSVAMLEPFTQSIFRFSPRALELQNQIRSGAGKDNPLPKGMPVTAMAFSPNKMLFIFVNGQVFFAINIP